MVRSMGGRERAVDRGAARGRAVAAALARELHDARLDRGLTQEAVGRAVGLSGAQVSRIERGLVAGVSIEQVGRLLAVVGLELSARAYPTGVPLRDAAHVALLGRLRVRLHRTLGWRTEVPLSMKGDLRAWDGVIRGPTWRIGVEAETRPIDAQALVRRVSLKARDDGVDGILLVLADTRHDRAFLRAAGDVVMSRFPADGRQAIERLRMGLRPDGDAVVLL